MAVHAVLIHPDENTAVGLTYLHAFYPSYFVSFITYIKIGVQLAVLSGAAFSLS